MFVIGTAGHVDHGKSTLVKALTGIDPDRLQEEKDREMTIDLGFAWLTLPSGREVSVVDVPGHERFINNMLAGVHGMDLAMLIVAAEESVMPQTREHLAILDLLRVKRGVAVITKRDLVDDDWLGLVRADVQELLKGSSLENAPIVAVSAQTGQGLDELKALLDNLLEETPPRRDVGRPRLPVDRSFVMPGFGTVVTGTLVDGTLSVGQEVELVPSGFRARIRGLQSHRTRIDRATPGSRTAVNLSGVEHTQVQRGNVLTTPGWLRPTDLLDARLRASPWSPLTVRHNMGVTLHAATSEVQARVRLLDATELKPGQEGWAQVHLETPLPVVQGDVFVLRASDATIAGGEVIDAAPKRHRRFQEATLRRLTALGSGSPRQVILSALEGRGVVPYATLLKAVSLPEEQVSAELRALLAEDLLLDLSRPALARQKLSSPLAGEGEGEGDNLAPSITPNALLIARNDWEELQQQATDALAAHHAQFPLRRGLPKEDLRSRLNLPPAVFPLVLAHLLPSGAIAEDASTVRIPTHVPHLPPDKQRAADAYVAALEAGGFTPPADAKLDTETLAFLADQGRVVHLAADVVYGAQAYARAKDLVVARLRQNGKITVGDARDLLGASRRYALALLEHLDTQHITRRQGDERVLVGR